MMNIKLLAVVTPPSIYHGCSIWKTFWEGNFSGEEKFTLVKFSAVNMKHFVLRSVNKHREIKGGDKYVILDLSLKIDSLDNIRITSSESKFKLGKSGKGLIAYLSIKSKTWPNI